MEILQELRKISEYIDHKKKEELRLRKINAALPRDELERENLKLQIQSW